MRQKNIQEIEEEREQEKKKKDEYNRTHYAGQEISKKRVRVKCLQTFTMHNGQTCVAEREDTIPENYIAGLVKARYIEVLDEPVKRVVHTTAVNKTRKETRG